MTDLIADLAEVVAQDEAGATDRELGSLTLAIYRAHAAEIEAMARDAERYRKIRIGRSVWDGDVYAMTFAAGGDYPVRGDELDAFADAMRSAKEDGNG